MNKEDEKARDGGFFDRERMGYQYLGKPAESEHGTLRMKRAGKMVTVFDPTKTEGADAGETKTPADATNTTAGRASSKKTVEKE